MSYRDTIMRLAVNSLYNRLGLALVIGSSIASGVVHAQESKVYTYDALGRVTKVTITDGPVSGTKAEYVYDPAGNRTNVTVSGSANSSPSGGDAGGGVSVGGTIYIVVPLNGFTLIPISR